MEAARTRGNLAVSLRLAALVRPLGGHMLLAVLLGTAGHLCAAAITVLGGSALVDLLGLPAPLGLRAALVCMGACAAARGLLRFGEQYCNHFIAFKLLALIRDRVFAALRRLSPAKLEGRDKGNLISVITADIELLEVFYAHTVSPVAIALLVSLTAGLFIGKIHPLLALLAAAAYLTVGVALPLVLSRLSGEGGMRLRRGAGELSSFVLESLHGLPELLQFRMGARRAAEMDRRTRNQLDDEERIKKLAGRGGAATEAVISLFDLAMLGAAAALYLNGRISFDGVLLSVLALMSSFGPVVALAGLGSTLQSTFAAGSRVLDILDEEPVTEEVFGEPEVDFTGARVRGVSFSYGGAPVLRDAGLEIPPGRVVCVMGPSGSGKSTLLKLLMRFWDADAGRVELSRTDVRRINTENLRNLEGLVTQDTHLFHDSIENNLRIARPSATREELESACKKASIHDFIMRLPQGYETQVGELGETLSGGERQRLGLARAFLHDAPFLLLDEPTSNLDSLNEAVILKALAEAGERKTVLLVSHRRSTLRVGQVLYAMEDGRVRCV